MRDALKSRSVVWLMLMIASFVVTAVTTDAFGQDQEAALPTSLGFFLQGGGDLIELLPLRVETIIGLRLKGLNTGYAVDGFSGSPAASIVSGKLSIVAYQQSIDVNEYILADAVFVKSKQAYQLNIQNTDARFFSNVYDKGYYDIIDINLWRPSNEVPMTIEPVISRPGMYKFTPRSELMPGYYVFFKKGAIHKDKTVFSTDEGRSATACYFEVKAANAPSRSLPVDIPNDISLLEELKKHLVSVRNYDVRWSVAPNEIAASKEKSLIINSVDAALSIISKALAVPQGLYDAELIAVLQRARDGLETCRAEYVQNRSGRRRVYPIERDISNYLKISRKSL